MYQATKRLNKVLAFLLTLGLLTTGAAAAEWTTEDTLFNRVTRLVEEGDESIFFGGFSLGIGMDDGNVPADMVVVDIDISMGNVLVANGENYWIWDHLETEECSDLLLVLCARWENLTDGLTDELQVVYGPGDKAMENRLVVGSAEAAASFLQTVTDASRETGSQTDGASGKPAEAPLAGNFDTGNVMGLTTDKLSGRSGPSTAYSEVGTYKVKDEWIKLISYAYDHNGVCWVQCEVPYGNKLRRIYTGLKRFDSTSFNLYDLPEEAYGDVEVRVIKTSKPLYGPGEGYGVYKTGLTVDKGQRVITVSEENGYAQVEWTTSKQSYRAWVPLSMLEQ